MARIAGINLPREKRLEIGLTYIYGIGQSRAHKICEALGLSPDTKVRDLTEDERDLARARLADAVDVGQPDLEPLLVREVDACDSRHALALPLLVAGVRADDQGAAVPLDHAAALAHGLDGRSDFHDSKRAHAAKRLATRAVMVPGPFLR